MKGPSERLKYDFRRLWECPRCGLRRRSGGDTTSESCDCALKENPPRRTPMRLIAEGGRRAEAAPPGVHVTRPQIEQPDSTDQPFSPPEVVEVITAATEIPTIDAEASELPGEAIVPPEPQSSPSSSGTPAPYEQRHGRRRNRNRHRQ
jgi:hypothetical protein